MSIRSLSAVGCAFGCLANASPVLATETISYVYDELGRLVELHTAGGVNTGEIVLITYDAAGNRLIYTVSGA